MADVARQSSPSPEREPDSSSTGQRREPLSLESRGAHDRGEPTAGSVDVERRAPALILERWAVVARRIRAGYAGYKKDEDYARVEHLLERTEPPRRQSVWNAVMERMGWRPRGRSGSAADRK